MLPFTFRGDHPATFSKLAHPFLLCAATTLLAAAGYLFHSAFTVTPPSHSAFRLEALPMTAALGEMTAGNQVRTIFMLRNAGPEQISIVDIRSECSCTVPELPKKHLNPNEQTELIVSFKAGPTPGLISRSVLVLYRMPESGKSQKLFSLRLSLTAQVSGASA